jgi:protein-S-isoprenylcysteine O-methyltransferase Ste14
VIGWALIVLGAAAMIQAFARFARDGLGTPAPIAPTAHLVVSGAYRYVRNPMYLALLAAIVGQALALGQTVLLLYALAVWVTVWTFVTGYEQPTLARQFGPEYDAYRRAVPGWWPRLRTWDPRR